MILRADFFNMDPDPNPIPLRIAIRIDAFPFLVIIASSGQSVLKLLMGPYWFVYIEAPGKNVRAVP